jgi:phosphoribosylaminoimidazole carboxylase (NCAIR synthetase)
MTRTQAETITTTRIILNTTTNQPKTMVVAAIMVAEETREVAIREAVHAADLVTVHQHRTIREAVAYAIQVATEVEATQAECAQVDAGNKPSVK